MDQTFPVAAHNNDETRPRELRSVESNSSLGLSRRPRTRTRSRTITRGSASANSDIDSPSNSPSAPYFEGLMVSEPVSSAHLAPQNPPLRPPRSPRRPTAEITDRKTPEVARTEKPNLLVRPATQPSTSMTPVENQAGRRPSMNESRFHPPSSFGRVPRDNDLRGARDSVLTQDSATSSSIYPASTSTASGTESPPYPQSVLGPDQEDSVPIVNGHEFDGDDVSYRLQLLVKNSYFLPPAHSKPKASDFASVPSTPKKASSPGFFGVFRVGRSRSKPPTPQEVSFNASIARTPEGAFPLPRISAQRSKSQPRPSAQDRLGRVLVVRETVPDLSAAAQQAERELKIRRSRDRVRSVDQHRAETDVIDPTDAVDLPPLSPSMFAAQSSALRGLGVQDSVGAALLADRLPPKSPVSDGWRTALLQAAVGHSLNSTPLPSPVPPQAQISHRSRSVNPVRSRSRPRVDKRIISNPVVDSDTSPSPSEVDPMTSDTGHSFSKRSSQSGHDTTESAWTEHVRTVTPSVPLLPLNPPPRRQIINPLYSLSQTDLALPVSSEPPPPLPTEASIQPIRRSTSSLKVFSDEARHNMTITPPPIPTYSGFSQAASERSSSAFGTQTTSESRYSDDTHPRSSTAMSRTVGRPSVCESSQPSPTASAFHGGADYPPMRDPDGALDVSRPSTSSRYHTISPPPPRVSATFQAMPLAPPPRKSSLRHRHLNDSESDSDHESSMEHRAPSRARSTARSSGRTTSFESMSDASLSIRSDISMQLVEPGPTTPPLPGGSRSHGHHPLSLRVPTNRVIQTINSAPPPSSHTSFFDTIQSQPNAMDDLDSSSEDESDDGFPVRSSRDGTASETHSLSVPFNPRTRTLSAVHAPPRAPFMRLGNHSVPHIPSTPDVDLKSLLAVSDPRQPIGNIPAPAPFFAKKIKSDSGHGSPMTSAVDLIQYINQEKSSVTGSPSDVAPSSGSVPRGSIDSQARQRAREEQKKLDGLLLQHMQAEKDRFKQITRRDPNSSGHR